MKLPLEVTPQGPGTAKHLVDAAGQLIATLPKTHRIEAVMLARAMNAHDVLVHVLELILDADQTGERPIIGAHRDAAWAAVRLAKGEA